MMLIIKNLSRLVMLLLITLAYPYVSHSKDRITITGLIPKVDSTLILNAGDKIRINFEYESEKTGIYIFAEPIYRGKPVYGLIPYGSRLFKTTQGEGNCNISLARPGKIDSIRLYFTDTSNEQNLLFETFIPVDIRFSNSKKDSSGMEKSANLVQDSIVYIPAVPDSLIIQTYTDEHGKKVDVILIAGAPPKDYVMPVSRHTSFAVEPGAVPAYSWSFGCSATAAAMIAAYYDNHGYPNMYTGPTNNGNMPITNEIWGTVVINGEIRHQCPLSATMQELDGRVSRGHVDDYWISYGNKEDDPYITNGWTEHEYGECVADYMKTNQSVFGNIDGATSFYFYNDGSAISEDIDDDGAYGLQLFFESRGYEVTRRFNQYIQGYNGNTNGFSFEDYVQEIDAGHLVMIHVEGHSMLGYGYDLGSNLIYLHNTWDYSDHSMTWGGYYDDMVHYGVSVFNLEPTVVYTSIDTTVCENDLPLLWANHIITEAGTYIDTIPTSSGIDSIVTLNVTILPASGVILDTTLCEGTPGFVWGNHLIQTTIDSSYVETLISQIGCDSTITLNVTILPLDYSIDTVEICFGASVFEWNNQLITSYRDSVYRDVQINTNGCDSISELNVLINYDCWLDCPQHFHPVWEGIGVYDPMNIYIINARIDRDDLQTGDQIGVFDGDVCVGFGRVVEPIDHQNVLSIIAGADDGTGIGFTTGNEISYKIWRCNDETEFDVSDAYCFDNQLDPVDCSAFQAGASSFVDLFVSTKRYFATDFQPGWNLFSLPVLPDSVDIEYNFYDLIQVGSLVKIQDETGASLEDLGVFGDWNNEIGDIRLTEGYKVKVTEYDSLYFSGSPAKYPFGIPLNPGWNIMGFPSFSYVNGMEVVQQLIDRGTLIKVQNEQGKSIEDLGIYGGWQNFIGNFWAGEGFKVKVADADTLWIQESYPKSTVALSKPLNLKHFNIAISGNGVDHMNFNLVDINKELLAVGDEISVYDETTCVGAMVITKAQLRKGLVSIPVSSADNTGMPGFTEGNPFSLRIWKADQNREIEMVTEHLSGPAVFTKHESVLLSLEKSALTKTDEWNGTGITEVNCYPNPFAEAITIELNLAADAEVNVEVLNQYGQRVKTIAPEQQFNSGIHRMFWDGSNSLGNQVSHGMYYLKVKLGDSTISKKIMYNKQ